MLLSKITCYFVSGSPVEILGSLLAEKWAQDLNDNLAGNQRLPKPLCWKVKTISKLFLKSSFALWSSGRLIVPVHASASGRLFPGRLNLTYRLAGVAWLVLQRQTVQTSQWLMTLTLKRNSIYEYVLKSHVHLKALENAFVFVFRWLYG